MRELSPLLGKSGSPLKGEKGKTGFISVRGRWRTDLSKAAMFDISIYKVRYFTDSMLSNIDGDAAT